MADRLMIREYGLPGYGDAREESVVLVLAKWLSEGADSKVR